MPAHDGVEDAEIVTAGRRSVDAATSSRASRRWWDDNAEDYQSNHAEFLGDADFVWSPERFREADARLLGDVVGLDVLEVGCGAAQCARWLAAQGAHVVGLDLSAEQLALAGSGAVRTGIEVPLLQADATRLPFADGSFDAACSAYGAVPFVAEPAAVMREVARVLRPGGRWVFSVTHPIRWAFADDPGPGGLTAQASYFDRTPYVEQTDAGQITYVEHHRTLGDRIREIVAAGLVLDDLVEPEWPADLDQSWGQWSPLRGRLLPGTAVFVTHRP
jgi:ubiquinone/menaquinone biosynthesis C-methylase UbiE